MQNIGMDLVYFKDGHIERFKEKFSVLADNFVCFTAVKSNTAKGLTGIMIFSVKQAMHVFYAAELKKK